MSAGEPCDPGPIPPANVSPASTGIFTPPTDSTRPCSPRRLISSAKIVTRFLHVPVFVTAGFFTVLLTALRGRGVPVAMAWWAERMGYSVGRRLFRGVAPGLRDALLVLRRQAIFLRALHDASLILSADPDALRGRIADGSPPLDSSRPLGLRPASSRAWRCRCFCWSCCGRRRRSPNACGATSVSFLAGAGFMFLLVGILQLHPLRLLHQYRLQFGATLHARRHDSSIYRPPLQRN